MSFKTMTQLVTDVEVALYQLAGPQVQIYSQDIIAQMVQEAFDHYFMRRFWHHFRRRQTLTLDGTTGKPTTTPTVTDYMDIENVFRSGSRRALPILPASYNTLDMVGTTPRFIEASGDTKIFLVYPITATGQVQVVYRARPNVYSMDDEVECDAVFVKHYCAWSYYTGDGSSPGEVAKHQMLFESRLKQLEMADQEHAVQLDAYSTEIPTDWYYS